MSDSLTQRLVTIISAGTDMISVADALRQIKNDGFGQEATQHALEALRKKCKTELEEDRILDILDLVTGFCPTERKVW